MKPQLFILHYAGGNAYSFKFFEERLLDGFEVNGIELPGRGKRLSEPLIRERGLAAMDLFTQIKEKRNGRPYILYGHSMGALLAFLVTKKMEIADDPPLHLVVTGSAGPVYQNKVNRYMLPENKFKAEIQKLGGTPPEVLNNKELFQFYEPILRADFEIVEKESGMSDSIENKISTPTYVIMGTGEENNKQIENWRNYCSGPVNFRLLEGGHFFIYLHTEILAELFHEIVSE